MSRLTQLLRSICPTAAGLALAGALTAPPAAEAQQPTAPPAAPPSATIRVNENVNLRFGVLVQGWMDLQQDTAQATASGDQHYQQNLFLRRVRLLVGGQVAPQFNFFLETDVPNLGRVSGGGGKTLNNQIILQDAWAEWKSSDAFMLDGGLMLIPLCRNCIQSAASLLPIDYGPYTFSATSGTQSSVGRDVGIQAKGYVLGKRLEYRAGLFSGRREGVVGTGTTVAGRNAFRGAGRLQLNLLDVETTPFFYTGTYLGKRRILALGVGVDAQQKYDAFAGDVFFDHPVGMTGDGFTAQFDFIRFNGDRTITTLPKQNTIYAEAGYFNNATKLMPFFAFGNRGLSNAPASNRTEQNRFQAGLGWMPAGHNANVKAAYSRVNPKNTATTYNATNEFTVQLQAFFY